MKATVLMPYADHVSEIAMEVFDVLDKHGPLYSLMALAITLDCTLERIASGCPPEKQELGVAEIKQLRKQLLRLNQAIASVLYEQQQKDSNP